MTTNTHLNDTPSDDLMAVQLRLEEDMTQRGLERYMKEVASATEHGREDGTLYGQGIIKGRIEQLSAGIQAWKANAAAGGAAVNSNVCFKLVKNIPTDVLAFMTLKNIISGLSVVRTLTSVAISLAINIEDEVRLSEMRDNERKIYNRIVEGAKKRSSAHFKHIYAVRIADKHDTWKRWLPSERLHVGMKMLDLCIEHVQIVEIISQSTGKNTTVKCIKPLESTLAWLDKKNDAMALMRPQYEPMVVIPRDWTTPHDGGYISTSITPLTMVKSNNKAYMDELEHIDMPVVYAAVNALQHTAWQINTPVLDVMKTLWQSDSTVGCLPPRNGIALPEVPHDIDTNEDARKGYRVEAAKIYGANLALLSRRVGVSATLDIAERYSGYRKLYMPYQLDFRGRIYAVPQLNPQGTDYQKSLLRFATGKALGAEGWKWLAVHGCNLAGNDKCSFEDRVNWVLDNEEEILAIAANPYDNRGWCGAVNEVEIDKPWQFLSFCFEWAGYAEHGEGFVSKIPVAMDGSCSGIQHFSAMLKDEIGGNAVNLIPADLPQDVYRQVADKVILQAQLDVLHGTGNALKHKGGGFDAVTGEEVAEVAYLAEGTKALATQWLAFGISRKTTKRSVMTLAYGSKEYGFKDQLLEDILNPARMSGKDFPFSGDGYAAAGYLAKAIWVAVNEVLVKAGEAMKWLQTAASVASAENLPIRWTTAVGFPVMQAYQEMALRRVKTSIGGSIVKLSLQLPDGDKLDSRRQSSGIAPNFVHSCDAAHMMLTTVRASQAGIKNFAMIHDSFGTTAGDVDVMYRVVRESFVEMYEGVDVLGDFRDEIAALLSEESKDDLPPVPASGTLDLAAIAESRYCFA
jgi:DNA-directed RNA polymerase